METRLPDRRETVTLRRESPWDDGVDVLVEMLDAYLFSIYPAEVNHILSLSDLDGPNVVLIVARVDGVAVGCGAVRFIEEPTTTLPGTGEMIRYGEIKRMFVNPAFRGRGIARSILESLEAATVDNGLATILLEAGIYQPEALALYERLGYVRRRCFGRYLDNEYSVFFEKSLA